MDKVPPSTLNYTPNVSLFRFIGGLGIDLNGSEVLEIGFGGNGGADLKAAQQKGAFVFGTDINQNYVDAVDFVAPENLACARAGVDEIPFNKEFSLIYSRDTIYYLTPEELKSFFIDAHRHIAQSGYLIVQFLEADLISDTPLQDTPFSKSFFKDVRQEAFFGADNPITFLNPIEVQAMGVEAGFSVAGGKRLIQSHDTEECKFRVDKYIAFRKD